MEVNKEIEYIGNFPEHYQRKYKEFRQSLVTRFPYAIFYLIEEEQKRVVIFGVLHTSRNPEIVRKRMLLPNLHQKQSFQASQATVFSCGSIIFGCSFTSYLLFGPQPYLLGPHENEEMITIETSIVFANFFILSVL